MDVGSTEFIEINYCRPLIYRKMRLCTVLTAVVAAVAAAVPAAVAADASLCLLSKCHCEKSISWIVCTNYYYC